jgi:hypothetical protein
MVDNEEEQDSYLSITCNKRDEYVDKVIEKVLKALRPYSSYVEIRGEENEM